MSTKNKQPASGVDPVTSLVQSLYQRAESALAQRVSQSPEQFAALSPEQAQRTLHELQVHQIELEMQNEELRRKQVELDESLTRYVDFYDLAPVGYCTVTEKGLIKEVNLAASTLLNIPRKQLVQQPSTRFIFNDDQDIYYKFRRQLTDADGPLSLELRLRKQDGAPFWAHMEVAKARGGDGSSEMRMVIKDITERKNIEASLKTSEMRYRTLIEWLPEPVVVHANGEILYVNPAAIEMFGATCASDLTGTPVLDLVHPDFRKLVSKRVTEKVEHGQNTPRLEQKLLKRDGTAIDVEVQGTQIYYDGKPAVHAVMRDITERKKSQAVLRLSANVFSHVREGIAVTDANATIIDVNPAFTRITGYSREEALGQNPRILQSGRQNKDFYLAMWRDLLADGQWSGEIWNKRKNGEIYPELLNITAVKDAQGNTFQYVGMFADISERKHSEEIVRQLAYYDPLTGLANRLLFNDRVTQAMLASKRTGHHGALLLLDLDNFKSLNDTYGHGAGDLLLMEVAMRLKTCVREVDAVGRLGGDEFVVLLKDLAQDEVTAKEQVVVLAEKIRGLLAVPYVLTLAADAGRVQQPIEHHCTASLGVALFLGTAVSREDCIKHADIAMYQAKNAGRDTVCFFDTLMKATQRNHLIFEEDMRKAVFNKQFRLYYQAQVTSTSEITGVEALLRWQHPTRGWVSPAEFIATAEKTGLILPLGLWVLETACTQLARWADQAATSKLTMAVNVTSRQFHHGDFVEQLVSVLERTGANPGRVRLELTESVLITDVESVIVKMNVLKAMGIGISLDDFGTGFSSLEYLKRLPLDQLKIAQSFVRDILVDAGDAVIAKTVIALANNLGLTVIAEGVETEPQRALLAALGCHHYQGYLFSRALPVQEFEALIKAA